MNLSVPHSRRDTKAARGHVPSLKPIPIPAIEFSVTARPGDMLNSLNRLVQIDKAKSECGLEAAQFTGTLNKQTARLIELNAQILNNSETKFTQFLEKIGITSRPSRLQKAHEILCSNRNVTTSIISQNRSAQEFHDINKNVVLERLTNACVLPSPKNPGEILRAFCSAGTISGDPSLTAEDFSKMDSSMLQRLHRTLESGIISSRLVVLTVNPASDCGFSPVDKPAARELLSGAVNKLTALALRRETIAECIDGVGDRQNLPLRKAQFLISELGQSLYGNLAPEVVVHCLREKALSVLVKCAREIVGPQLPAKSIFDAVKNALLCVAEDAKERNFKNTVPHDFVDNISDIMEALEQKRRLSLEEHRTLMNCILLEKGLKKADWPSLTPLGVAFITQLTRSAVQEGLSLTLQTADKKLTLSYLSLGRLLNQHARMSPQKNAEFDMKTAAA